MKSTIERIPLSRWTVPLMQRVMDEVGTARRLGYTVEIRFDGSVMVLQAVKKVPA